MANCLQLRPFEEPDLPFLLDLYGAQAGPFIELDPPPTHQRLREQWFRNRFVSETDGRLLVTIEGQSAGLVSWIAQRYGPNPQSRCWNIGIILAKRFRRQGLGAAAQSALATHLFATTDANRVEAGTDIENTAERGSLVAAGFNLDGILRGAQYRAGTWHDMAIYSRTRTDPSAGARETSTT